MLTKIRERATGWLAWVIVILITIPFALWGIQSYFGDPSETPVATVDGESIGVYAYQNEMSRRRQAMTRQAGGNYDPALLESIEARTRVLESMISTRLMNQYVRARNYRLSDDQLKQRIQSSSVFSRDGQFDANLYRDLLRANGFTPQSFEAAERQNAAIEQLSSAVVDSAFVTHDEVERLLALQAQTRQTDYMILPANRFEADLVLDDGEAEQHYQDNLADYEAPARIKVDYLELSVEQLAEGIELSEAEVSEAYAQTSEHYKQAETRKASHILFAVDAPAEGEEADPALAEAALASAEQVLAEARDGADFAELAGQHSDDPGSKERGGDLGVVTRGQMVAPFEEAVFDMVADEIRGPIKTRFGYHLIKLTELQEERQKLLEEVREEVAAKARRVQAENQFAELGETFRNLVFEDPESLVASADELGLEIQQTDWFTENSGEGLADEAAVRRAAFGEDVLTDDLNSAAIELGFDRLVALRKADYEASHLKPFEEVRDDVEQHLKSQISKEQIKQLGDQLVAELDAGQTDWAQVLEAQQLESQALAEARDQVPANLAELRDAVFSHASPPDAAPLYNGLPLGNGDYAIYALKEVRHGDIAGIDEAQRTRLSDQLRARDGGSFYQNLVQTIRQNADVFINQEQLQNPATAFQ